MNDNSYLDWQSMSDASLNKSIGEFVKHSRLQQNKTQGSVAEDAGISRSTLSLLERGETVTVTTLLRVLRVLGLLHVMDTFKVQQQVSPIELAKLEQKKRRRAGSKKSNEQSENNW